MNQRIIINNNRNYIRNCFHPMTGRNINIILYYIFSNMNYKF